MATTMEMFVAGVALIVNTTACIAMYFIGNVILAPIVDWAETSNLTRDMPAVLPISDMTYIYPAIWGLLLIMEVICVVGFFVVIGRRPTYEYYY